MMTVWEADMDRGKLNVMLVVGEGDVTNTASEHGSTMSIVNEVVVDTEVALVAVKTIVCVPWSS